LFLTQKESDAKNENIYDAITASAEHDGSEAKMFCLLEIYKRQRNTDPNYLGYGGSWTGIRAGRRVSQAQRLQDFISSGQRDLDRYMEQFPDDEKSLLSGHMKVLTNKTKQLYHDEINNRSNIAIPRV
jgi:hypothetical protein